MMSDKFGTHQNGAYTTAAGKDAIIHLHVVTNWVDYLTVQSACDFTGVYANHANQATKSPLPKNNLTSGRSLANL